MRSGETVGRTARVEHRLRHLLDSVWFWLGVAYLGLVAAMISLFMVSLRTGHLETQHLAQQQAARTAQVENCFDNAGRLGGINAILTGIEVIALNQIENLQTALAVNPRGPEALIWRISLTRAKQAMAAARDFRATNAATTPTRQECRQLAADLGISH